MGLSLNVALGSVSESMKHRIYVPLDSKAASLREIDATAAGDGRFRIVGRPAPGERLQFKSGEVVECEIRRLPTGAQALVAIRSMFADPEYRKRRNTFAVCGVLMGGIVGAVVALWMDPSLVFAGGGFVIGAIVFGYCSVRWGDDAWDFLSHLLKWDRRSL
jgi:hypothetical protein